MSLQKRKTRLKSSLKSNKNVWTVSLEDLEKGVTYLYLPKDNKDKEWINVDDYPPKEKDDLILACTEIGVIEIVWIDDKSKCTNKPFSFDEYDTPVVRYEDIKYWQPLPKPPSTPSRT